MPAPAGGTSRRPEKSPAALLHEQHLPFGVEGAHAADVAGEVALRHKVRGHDLIQPRRLPVGELAGRGEGVHEVRREDGVAEPKRREEHLAESADVDNPTLRVQPLQGFEGPAGVAVLRVVVVLQDPCKRAPRPTQKLQPPGEAHRDPKRVLVRGRHAREARGERA